MNRSESIQKLAEALCACQAELPAAPKDATNPAFRSHYATLGSVIDTSKALLARNGLSIAQFPTSEDGYVGVDTILMHVSGEWISERYVIPVGEQRGNTLAQAAGSVITYLRRYAWASVLGMYADEDTDGNAPQTFQQRTRQAVDEATGPRSEPPPNARSNEGTKGGKLRFKMDEMPTFKAGNHVFEKGPHREKWNGWTWGQMAEEHRLQLYYGNPNPDNSPISNMMASEFVKGWNAEQAAMIDKMATKQIEGGWKPEEEEKALEMGVCDKCGADFENCSCVPF